MPSHEILNLSRREGGKEGPSNKFLNREGVSCIISASRFFPEDETSRDRRLYGKERP
jgi:hypothetical protein